MPQVSKAGTRPEMFMPHAICLLHQGGELCKIMLLQPALRALLLRQLQLRPQLSCYTVMYLMHTAKQAIWELLPAFRLANHVLTYLGPSVKVAFWASAAEFMLLVLQLCWPPLRCGATAGVPGADALAVP